MPRTIRPIRIEGDVAYVPLTQGYEAIIDAADVHLVQWWNWHAGVRMRADKWCGGVYAQRTVHGSNGFCMKVFLHRVLCEPPDGADTDHIDGDGLNNRRKNLRAATKAQNAHNSRRAINNTSGIKGVYWHKQAGKWCAKIKLDGRRRHLGYFTTKEAAAAAYAEASVRLHGEFGRTE